jgi:alkylation response protein AidB-like acyl-CoA dehydrogenase
MKLIDKEIKQVLQKYSSDAEILSQLHPEQLNIINKQRWFHLFVPEEYGGLGLSLPDAVHLEEEIAYTDGSVGWVVTLCAGAAMFIGYFDRVLVDEVFSDPDVCIAGSGHVNGTAEHDKDGFIVNGTWPYASGAPHAKWFTANCVVDNTVRSFIFKREEVALHPSWKYIGLNATAGYSYSARHLKVPANRSFIIDPAHARMPQPVYKYPFLQLAETTLAANISGMCLSFIEVANEMLNAKQPKYARAEEVKRKGLELTAKAGKEMELLRNAFYGALDDSWQLHTTTDAISDEVLKKVSGSSLRLAQRARELVNEIYPYCGLNAARTETMINQIWRNINTASQHNLLLVV